MEKSTVEKRMRQPFVMVPKSITNSNKLSMGAKAFYAYLLGLPENWEFWFADILKHFKEGKDKIRAVRKELVENNLLIFESGKLKAGKFTASKYILLDPDHFLNGKNTDFTDTDFTDTDFTDTDFTDTENQLHNNNNYINNNINNNDINNIYKTKIDLTDQTQQKKHDEILSNPKTSHLSAIESFSAENDTSAQPLNLNSTTGTKTALKSISSRKHASAKKNVVEIDVDMVFSDELLFAARRIYDQANIIKTDQQISLVFLDFKTHHAKKGTKYKNWVAAWNNWVVKDIKFSSKHKAESVKRDILYVEPNLYKPGGGMFANETEKNEYYEKIRLEKQEQILDHVTDDELDRFCGVLK